MDERPGIPDLALLRSFLAIAQTASMSAAGEALGLSQPTVSQHLQRLETQLGVALVDRSSRPLGLTQAGRLLAAELPGRLDEIETLLDRARVMDRPARQVLRMAMPDSLSCIMGAEFLSASGALARTFELHSGISPWIEDSFRARRFDLVVDSPPFDPATRAEFTPLFRDPFIMVSPAKSGDTPPEETVSHGHQVAYGRSSKFGATTAAIAQELGAVDQPRFSFDSSQSLLRLVQAGYGWAITSVFCLFQTPSALKDIHIHRCREDHVRAFFLLSRAGESPELVQEAAERLIRVFCRLVDGPWSALSPLAGELIRAANPEHFPRK